MQKVLADCGRVGNDAITLESMHQNYDAYRKYLFCCVKAFAALSEEVNDIKPSNNAHRLKLAKLARNCTERIVDLCDNSDSNGTPGFYQNATRHSNSAQPSSQSKRAHRTVSASAIPQPPRLSSPNEAPSHSTHPAHEATTTKLDFENPETLARLQNQALLDRHKTQMENPNYNASRKARLTLELHRKMMENLEVAKKRKVHVDQQLMERRQQLRVLADRRIATLHLSDPKKEKQNNDLLTAILEHDEKHKWVLSLKSKLSEGKDLNINIASEFCRNVMRNTTHPLAILLRDSQQQVKEVTQPLYVRYNQLLAKCVSVPYEYSDPEELSDEAVARLEDTLASDMVQDDEFEHNCDRNAEEVKTAIYKTDKEIGKLLEAEGQPTDDTVTKKMEDEDDMDYLFDSDEDDNSAKLNNQVESSTYELEKEKTRQQLEEVQSFAAIFSEQLRIVIKSLHETMYSLSTMFVLAYDKLNCEEGCSVIDTAIHECLFVDIGEELQLLYRLANLKKERLMARVMTKYVNKDISSVQMKEKWYLDTRGECYDHLVSQLQTIINIYPPLEKMRCAVKVNRGVTETTSAFYQAREMYEPMGADDLVPIICFIVAKTGLPQVISECAIMEEFMPADYMKEEEGYSLATVLTAVEYLLSL